MTSKVLRQKLGLSCAEWARALAVSERSVMRWERGVKPNYQVRAIFRAIHQAIDRAGAMHVAMRLRAGVDIVLTDALAS